MLPPREKGKGSKSDIWEETGLISGDGGRGVIPAPDTAEGFHVFCKDVIVSLFFLEVRPLRISLPLKDMVWKAAANRQTDGPVLGTDQQDTKSSVSSSVAF